MYFKIRDLELKPKLFEVAFAPGEVDLLDPELQQAGPLTANGVAEFLDAVSEIHVRGNFHVRVNAPCDRCLEPAAEEIERSFDLYYRPVEELEGGVEVGLKAADSDVGFYEGDGISLIDILREQILLALPVQRLCREDCKGLCPICGMSLNEQKCSCVAPVVESRWDALKSFKPGHSVGKL
jgi:uncharacterized protein